MFEISSIDYALSKICLGSKHTKHDMYDRFCAVALCPAMLK